MVVIFSATDDGEVPFSVGAEGVNVQVDPTGTFVQLSWTCWLKPLTGVISTV